MKKLLLLTPLLLFGCKKQSNVPNNIQNKLNKKWISTTVIDLTGGSNNDVSAYQQFSLNLTFYSKANALELFKMGDYDLDSNYTRISEGKFTLIGEDSLELINSTTNDTNYFIIENLANFTLVGTLKYKNLSPIYRIVKIYAKPY